MNIRKSLQLVALLVALLLAGCASGEKREREAGWHRLHKLVLENLRIRRPAGPGADPGVGPGGMGYTSRPLPDAKFDCQPASELFRGMPLDAARECLASISTEVHVSYRLRLEAVPYWELEKPELAPGCLVERLGRIPVPREIVFQSRESGRLECYASRLELEADELRMLGVKWPLKATRLRLGFPLAPEELQLEGSSLLVSWSLRPFFQGSREEILSKVVPELLCAACIGRENLLSPLGPPPRHWPEE
ncbi:MAG: hypothetical protein NDJ89_01070 [Oligoflexia bacterium]|nr:hypothetical protein [Oligoflexia bacterium]